MFKLIALELRKNRLLPYLLAAVGIFFFSFSFCFMTVLVPLVEGAPLPVDMAIFGEWKGVVMLISTFTFCAFAVLSATMHAKITVEDYTSRRAILLFSYPQKRSSILLAKCGLVFIFTAVAAAVSNLAAITAFGLLSNLVGLLPGTFDGTAMALLLRTTALVALLAGAVGLIALRIGFWRRSVIVTVVSAFILCSPFGNLISFFPESSLIIFLVALTLLLGLGLLLFLLLLRSVNRMEAL